MIKYKVGILLFFIFICGCASIPRQSVVSPLPPVGNYHIVAAKQTLYSISKAYGVSISDMMRVNNISDANQISVGQRLIIPVKQRLYAMPADFIGMEDVRNLVGLKQHQVSWRMITLHHSGTKCGNAQSFNRNHRRRGMGGLFYHFVIGNGSGSSDGKIEVGWRWKQQREVNRRRDIQICLVGNFNQQKVSPAQFNSLVKLIKVLTQEYSIPVSNIRQHGDIRGAASECPGSNFPLAEIKNELYKS